MRLNYVSKKTGLAKSTIYKLMANGEFPKPIKLTTKSVGWPESVIEKWIQSRITPDA